MAAHCDAAGLATQEEPRAGMPARYGDIVQNVFGQRTVIRDQCASMRTPFELCLARLETGVPAQPLTRPGDVLAVLVAAEFEDNSP